MRLAVILILGLGVCGPMLLDAEKVVFVVPRYMRRTFASPSSPSPLYGLRGYKTRPSFQGPKRPYFSGYYGVSATSSEPFFPDEKPRVPQYGDDFNQGYSSPKEGVNHVIIPHGRGISHGISFGKEYIPQDPFKGANNGDYEFLAGNGNNQLEYAGQNHQEVKFEDDNYSRFQNQDEATPAADSNTDWPFPAHQSSYAPENYNQETNQEESGRQELLQEGYGSQGQREGLFFPKSTGGEEQRGVLTENVSSARNLGNMSPEGKPGMSVAVERKLEPIILRDTIDMKEYVEQVEAFTKNWPSSTAALQGLGWKNQILNPPSLTLPNYQGFNSWSNGLPRPPSSSYQVQEDSVEEPSQRTYRTVTM